MRRIVSASPEGSVCEGLQQLSHQADEVIAQPGHRRELHPVGDLVQSQPEPELARDEFVPLLDRHHVGSDVIDQILVFGILVADQEVVLTQDPGGHVGQHQAELGAAHDPTGGQRGMPALLARAVLLNVGQRRSDQSLHGADVGGRPLGPIGHLGSSQPVGRVQAGGLTDQELGPGRQLIELRLEVGRTVGGRGGLEDEGAGRHPLRQVPIDHARRCSTLVALHECLSPRRRAGDFLRRWPPQSGE